MGAERRRQIALGVLLVILLAVAYRLVTDRPAPEGPAAAASAGAGPGAAVPAAGAKPAPAVHLDALDQTRPKPPTTERDLFRFRPRSAPPAPVPTAGGGGATGAGPGAAAGSPEPAGPPPIPLKFIGVMDQGLSGPKVAILSDGLGPPMTGTEGATIAGRYRIVRIGAESIEIEYLDGRGRQTIRLSGS
jgi:hypothetical protein